MTQARIAQKGPVPVDVEAGKEYLWCACGNSKNQPFCDGSHKGGPFTPIKFVSSKFKTIYFCGCKASAFKPQCDGTHMKL